MATSDDPAAGRARRALPEKALRHGLTREVFDDRTCSEAIDAAFAVHGALGMWHAAETYKNALAVELGARELPVHRDATLSVLHRQRVVGTFLADLLVDDRLLLLVRADAALRDAHRTETVRGLALGQVRVGLALNFCGAELLVSRVV